MGEFEPDLQERAALKKQEIKDVFVSASAGSIALSATAANAYGVISTKYDAIYGAATIMMGLFGSAFLAQANGAVERYIALDNPDQTNPLDKK